MNNYTTAQVYKIINDKFKGIFAGAARVRSLSKRKTGCEMRETISHTRLTDENLARIRKYLQDSETACDDQHQFNPSEFDKAHRRVDVEMHAE